MAELSVNINFKKTFAMLDRGVVVFDSNEKLIFVNNKMDSLEKLLPQEMSKFENCQDFCKNKPKILSDYLKQIKIGEGFVIDVLNIKKVEEDFLKVSVLGWPLFNEKNQLEYYILVFTDLKLEPKILAIQEQLQLPGNVQKLFAGKESEVNVMQNFLKSLKDTVISAFDRKGNYIFMWTEPKIEERYGVKIKNLVGAGMLQFFPLAVVLKRLYVLRKMFITGKPHREDAMIKTPNGYFWHDTCLTPVKNDKGQVVVVFIVLRDITERHQMEKELQEKIAKLEKLNEIMNGREQEYQALVQENSELRLRATLQQ